MSFLYADNCEFKQDIDLNVSDSARLHRNVFECYGYWKNNV